MKMKNLMAFASLALGVVAAPFAALGANTDGHIRSINAMPDASHSIVFPNPDSPLKAGQDVYILIRLLNVNYGENMGDETKVCPWSFVKNRPDPLTWPKIGLSVGGNIRYAEYSELGPNSEPRVNPQFPYYTDLYFKYTVQTGDLGLPIKILQASGKIGEDFGDFMLQNVNTGGVTYNDWNLVCETAFGSGTYESVKFRYGPVSVSPAPGGVPDYPAKDEVRTYDFVSEGVYVKAVDFDGNFDDGAGTIWRYVYPGTMQPQVVTYQPKIVGTGDGDENSTVYLWSGDETVFTPWPESGDESEIITVDGRKVLRVTILKGESEARFLLKGGTAAVGSTATIYMSPTTTAGQSAVGEKLEGATVTRTIALKDPPPPTVKFEVIPETVDCKTNYEAFAAQLMVKIEPTADHDVKVKINASLDDTGDLEDIFDANLLGISTTMTGASYEDRETEVTVPANTPAVPLYLYTLGWTTKTLSKGIKFTPSTDDTSVEVVTTPATLFVRKSTPTITNVDPSEATVKPGRPTTFTVTLSDCYMNLMGAESDYVFTFESPDDAFDPMNNYDGDFEYEYLGDGEFEMDPMFDLPAGDYVAKITAESPNGQKCTATVTLKVGLQPSLQVTVNGQSSGIKVNEGGTLPVAFKIDGQTRNADSYAFLVPQDGCEVYVNTNMPPFSKGIRIPKNSFDPVDIPEIELFDGTQSLHFKAVLSSKEDEVKKVTGYDEGDLYVTATNVLPYVTYVTAAGLPVANGATLGKSVPKGVETSIAVGAWDVPADLDCAVEGKKFKTKVVVYDGTAATYEFEGNPEGHFFKHSFLNDTIGKEGTLVHVYVKDKDTSTYPVEPNWTFRVPVDDTPRVTLAYKGYDSGVWDETEANTHTLVVGLSVAAPTALVLRVTAPVADDDGYIKFKTNSRVDEESPGSYLVTLPAGATSQELYVSEMDGTGDTWGGIEVNAAVITDTDSGYGKPWNEYYEPANPLMPRVQNIPPEPSIPARYPMPTNDADRISVVAYTPITVPYKLASEVPADLAAGITVKLSVDGTDVETVTGLTDKERHTFAKTIEFNKPGNHSYTVTFYDKDDPDFGSSRTVYYNVPDVKPLRMVAHGPAGGNGTANSKRYRTADGLGEGRVSAEGGLITIATFESIYNFDKKASTCKVYGYGYKVGDIDDGVHLKRYPERDRPITSEGDAYDALTPTDVYVYNPQKDKNGNLVDSFLYTWLSLTRDNENGSLTDSIMGNAFAPEYTEIPDSGTLAGLIDPHTPQGASGNNGGGDLIYDDTLLEAIFSREYLASDNMGDINNDGIPDIYVDKYGFGIVNPSTGTLAAEGKDLDPISDFNEDADFLPTFGSTNCIPFDAKAEIRGYGEGLNDAPALAGIGGVKPDKVYLNPDPTAKDYCPSSTLSKVEYLAWLDYKAVHPTATADDWSPERPTDPTKADTDGDGFDDGFEYYSWYMAHVGYMDGDTHRYLTGRRYDPKNPGEGTLISSEIIAERMDPLVKYSGTDAQTRDTDNDGLPDLLEFELGTKPFDFDTDGDGLPDGWEVIIFGTDPLKRASANETFDAMLNKDGDAMAFTTPKLEADVSPKPTKIDVPIVFAVMDANGDSDGVQWYAVTNAPAVTAVTNVKANAWGFRLFGDKRDYIAYEKPVLTADGILARTLAKGSGASESSFRGAFVAGELSMATNISEDGSVTNVFNYAACGFPVRIEAGTRIVAKSVTSNVTAIVTRLVKAIPANAANACWTYGATGVGDGENSGFGKLAIGRNQAVPQDALVVSAPAADENVAYLHYLVYQQFGFDPRTAWNAKTPLNARWGTATAGKATRTREYTAYDEFLLYSFFLNNEARDTNKNNAIPAQASDSDWGTVWLKYTTNPQGPNESYLNTKRKEYKGRNSDNGADTDGDGVPDGWELYVMSGPKKGGKYVFPEPYSSFSPFVPDAKKDTTGDNDGLSEFQEFEGTDAIACYTNLSTTIKHDGEWKWFNKFFPTDPWSVDTDNDGLSDANEIKNADGFNAKNFLYAESDTGKTCVPGGGLNPCSVDTDQDGLPDGWEAQFAGSTFSPASTNLVAGLIDGMDGTVKDAFTTVNQSIDRDYDHDGLDNWQEYLVGAMRCWRYDDPLTRWDAIPDAAYYDDAGNFDIARAFLWAKTAAPSEDISDTNAFWYATLLNPKSAIYNPHLLTGVTPCALYFSRVTNGFDPNYTDAGAYYIFYDRIGDQKLADLWGGAPKKYISCSPLKADTDGDGMDDYWELFHGLNPLLGASDAFENSDGPCDIVFDAWSSSGLTVSALNNPWMTSRRGNGDYDFTVHPWLNGLATADPDGDDIRNQDEAIMPLVAPSTTWYHTDPSPLWMTDSSYSNSLVRIFFRMPMRFNKIPDVPGSVTDPDGNVISLVGFQGYSKGEIQPFKPDQWGVSKNGYDNWAFSFEENEGYDSDHDSTSDFEELQGKVRSKTDPQDADSPLRRQAMHFGGPANPSALQSMPFVKETYPRYGSDYPDDMSFLQYTVECWVRPESTADATVIERTSFVDPSHCADERYIRRNFRLAIRNGKWHASFDENGTLGGSTVEVLGKVDATANEWTYVVATYDATRLTLYVNGKEDSYVMSSLKPEYGSNAIVVHPADSTYWFDCEYSLHAFLLGASFSDSTDDRDCLNVMNGRGWLGYHDFFTGYIDEVRVWDGARSSSDIAVDYDERMRYTREDAIANRSAFYKQWAANERRYSKDPNSGQDLVVIPELRFHWTFDSIPGAENEAAVAKAPHGFLNVRKPLLSSPAGYVIPWWSTIVAGYGSVYEGNRNWVPWIPNTVTHLPRFDGTTLDSAYWSTDYAGDKPGTYSFARTAEPVSKWTQMIRNATAKDSEFRSTSRRFWLAYKTGSNATSSLTNLFEFTGRHLNQTGDDLLPLGGAFVKYVNEMWDDQGASKMHETTGNDADSDGLPDWWVKYAKDHYLPEDEPMNWNTLVTYEVGGVKIPITAGEAYLRDLAKGAYVDSNGKAHIGPTEYAQTAKSDGLIRDWWKELRKIDGEDPLSDCDNDGLNNYFEYVASEILPFRLNLDPRKASSDTKTLDYFRKVGKIYLGEMLTDHDQMEDHWERSLGDESIASPSLWDALKDGDEDGWRNFDENRYNGYKMGVLAQLIAHAMGDNEVLDAPTPSIKMKVRYNGDRPLVAASEDGAKKDGGTEESDVAPALVVRAFSKSAETGSYVMNPDASWTVTPGVAVDKEVYLGCWEDRVVRGTMAPGNIDIGNLDIKFAQVPQNDLYSWTDESGTHLARPYAEFKEAFEKNPSILQNIQDFEWLSLVDPVNEYTSSDRAVTVARDALTQKGYIAVYGERVGTVDLTTGEFEFDLGAMNKLRINYTFDGSKSYAAAWSYKEAIFKITYTAKVPSSQFKVVDFSLAKADKGFVRGGLNSIEAFYDLNANGTWDPGEPFGVVNDVEIGWSGRDVEIELTDMSAITPRVKLWGSGGGESSGGNQPSGTATSAADSDRGVVAGLNEVVDGTLFDPVTPAEKTLVSVSRYRVDGKALLGLGKGDNKIVLSKTFNQKSRDYLHEGDFLTDGKFDIDWDNLYDDIVSNEGVQMYGCSTTNISYLVTFNWDPNNYLEEYDKPAPVRACTTLVTRRFEMTRSVPTPCPERTVYNQARPIFQWRIDNEDKWASWFGTTYTAFKVRVKNLSGNLIYDSGFRRLPAKDSYGVYSWTAPLYVGEKVPGTGTMFSNLTDYTWEVAVYNAKFKTDSLMSVDFWGAHTGNPFSTPVTFRMNVTTLDASSESLAVRVCYAGPATNLADRVRVQAFASPDFTGDPVSEVTLGDVSLSPSGTVANATLVGLPSGSYFIRAYIDTNTNGVHDAWESWGYLNERDQASKPDIFNMVAIAPAFNPSTDDVRKVFIEDCDTDGDWFPDVWEAEQNNGVFDPEKIKPVTGNAELIGVNTNLDANLTKAMQGLGVLGSANGFALLTGFNPSQVKTTVAANGMSRFSVDNKVDSVTISALEFDADGNVVIRIDAKTSAGAIDPAAAAIYDLDLSKTVTCRIYRKTSLASAGWGDPVAEETVTVGAGPVTIPVEGEKADQAFFRAEIIEK